MRHLPQALVGAVDNVAAALASFGAVLIERKAEVDVGGEVLVARGELVVSERRDLSLVQFLWLLAADARGLDRVLLEPARHPGEAAVAVEGVPGQMTKTDACY